LYSIVHSSMKTLFDHIDFGYLLWRIANSFGLSFCPLCQKGFFWRTMRWNLDWEMILSTAECPRPTFS
jgi:hypothetical protein